MEEVYVWHALGGKLYDFSKDGTVVVTKDGFEVKEDLDN